MAFISLLLYIICIYLRPQEWIPAVYGWPLVDWTAILTIIFLFLGAPKEKKLKIKTPQNILLLGFLITIVLSHLAHFYMMGAFNAFVDFGKIVIMFFLLVNVLNSEKRIKIIIWFIILLTLVMAIQGIYQFNNGVGWANQPLSGGERITWIGIFNDPNDLALAFVTAIGFLLAFIFGRTTFFIKIISIPLGGVLMYALYLTNSRGGYLAFAATAAFYFLMRLKNKFFAIVARGALVCAVIILGPSRLSNISVQDASAHGRIEAWHEGIQMLKSVPLFGVGYGMFTDYHHLTAHNSYILVAAEEGLFGLFIWIALIYACFKGLNILTNKNNELKPYALGVEASLIGFLCASYFLSRSYVAPLYILLAIASAFAYTCLKKGDYRFGVKDIKIAGALSVGILVIAWISMRVPLKILG